MSAVNAITGYEYQGVNAAELGTGRWATFNQWRKSGYMVRKGEHGKRIMNRFATDEDGNRKFTGYSTVFEQAQVDKLAGDEQTPKETPTPPKKSAPKKAAPKVGLAVIRKVASQMSQQYKIMRVDYNGQEWTTDGFIAVNMALNPTKKTCDLQDKRKSIDLAKLIDGLDHYEVRKEATEGKYTILEATSIVSNKVNTQWYTNLKAMYPTATVVLTGVLQPILFKEGDNLVAALMPVKA